MVMQVSSLEWVATFNVEALKTGVAVVKTELGKVARYTKTVNTEGIRLNQLLKNLSGAFIAAGAVAGGIFAGILQAAPLLAPALKNIQFQIDRILKTIAPYIEPFLDFLGNVIGKFADWLEQTPQVADGIAKIIIVAMMLGTGTAAYIALKTFWDALMGLITCGKWLVSNVIKITVKLIDMTLAMIEMLLTNLREIGAIKVISIAIVLTGAFLALQAIMDFWEEHGDELLGIEQPFSQSSIGQRGQILRGISSSLLSSNSAEYLAGMYEYGRTFIPESIRPTMTGGDVYVTINNAGSVITETDLIDKIKTHLLRTMGLLRT